MVSQDPAQKKGHQNHGLFSDYYVQEILPTLPEWSQCPGIEKAFQDIFALYVRLKEELPNYSESHSEEYFIKPILKEHLGHHVEIQPILHTTDGTKKPDYAFFSTKEELKAARKLLGKNDFFKTAVAIGDAKAWRRDLDKRSRDAKDAFSNSNPNYQIDFYLRFAEKKWGILTNGRFWRLYNRETSFRMDNFYQVDLPALLEEGDLEAFKYFYMLFRLEAFLPDPTGKTFLDAIYEGSIKHAIGVEEDLRERVYETLRLLIQGFLDFKDNRLDPAGDLATIHANALILLYRLLFILYAESRGLLPINDPDYASSFSFEHLKADVHRKLDDRLLIPAYPVEYWPRLKALFALINEGYKVDGREIVPQYNGGLFDPTKHPFLENYAIGDKALAEAIDLLSRTKVNGDLANIFYRDLDVRHLGGIYEGLLEYRPRYADRPYMVVKEKGKEVIRPAPEDLEQASGLPLVSDVRAAYQVKAHPQKGAPLKIIPQGTIYLETDKGERKATGSYYTPDSIVRYIVENTLKPLVEKCRSWEEILKLKVLDPAIGSGHFLVGVVDYLAENLTYHPTSPLIAGGKEEKEIQYWRRKVVEACIYGVDVNPMAVELAKLSLWLHTVAKGEALSFLDHHIRCGNSLIGAKIEDLNELPDLRKKASSHPPKQLPLFMSQFTQSVATAIGHFLLIEQLESKTGEQIHAKEKQYNIVQALMQKFKEVATIWLSVYFGNQVNWSDYYHLQETVQKGSMDALRSEPWFQKAQAIAAEKRFFHWEMEFPEIFYDRYGREKDDPGFDAVVGNPPWGAALDENEKVLFKSGFVCGTGIIDSFALFLERGLNLIRKQGRHGMIYPDIILLKDYPMARKLVLDRSCIEFAVHWGQPFPDAQIDAATLIISECQSSQVRETQVVQVMTKTLGITNGGWESRQIPQYLFAQDPSFKLNLYLEQNKLQVIATLERYSQKFCTLYHSHEGIHSGNVREKLFPLERVDKDCYPLIFGRDEIDRYLLQWNGRYIRYNQSIIRKELGEYANLGQPEYFKPGNILIQRTGDRLKATINSHGYYFSNNLFVAIPFSDMKISPYYTLAILNSRLLTWYFRAIQPRIGRLFAELKIVHINQLPIRCIEFTTSSNEQTQLLDKGKTLYARCLAKNDQACVTRFVAHCLKQTPEKADVVHDLLAFLAEEMIEMKKAKQEAARRFFTWLKDVHRINKETLMPKTYLDKFWTHNAGEFFAHLERNKIKPNPSDHAQIRKAFEKASAEIRALMERIKATDRLIDHIVYQLYGLTEEEIRIVEGNNRPEVL